MQTSFQECRNALEAFLNHHLHGIENEERVEALIWYCQGLALDTSAKTVLGMATAVDPQNIQARRQRIQRAVRSGRFCHTLIFHRLQESIFASGQVQAYCFDDTGVAKKGEHSVGVHRQYSGTLGKVGNCQVIVSLHGISDSFGTVLGLQLYLPKSWCEDVERREKAEVPEDIEFRTKPQIAIDLLDDALKNGTPKLPVVADAGYGDSRQFREELLKRGLKYVVAVSSARKVWRASGELDFFPDRSDLTEEEKDQPYAGYVVKPVGLTDLARDMNENGSFRRVTWRNGQLGPMSGNFAALRVRTAERINKGSVPGQEEWLLIEKCSTGEFKYYLSNLPKSLPIRQIVRLAKMRWHIERDYQDMKQKLGFDRYEGRRWGGLHRHLAMAALLHAFISLHLEAFSP